MQKLNRQMKAEVYDWLHTRLYSELRGTAGKTEEISKKYSSPYVKSIGIFIAHIFIVVIVTGIFGNMLEGKIDTIYIAGFFLMVFGTLMITFRRMRALGKILAEKTIFTPSIPDDRSNEIYLYQFTADGMSINHYNKAEYVSSFKWSDVKYASLEETHRPKRYRPKDKGGGLNRDVMTKLLNDDLKTLKEQCPDYPYFEEVKLFPDDDVSIEFKLNNHGTIRLPIPSIWYESDFAYDFVDYIEEQLGDKYIPPAESIDLIEELFPKFYDRYFSNE